jgi:hypothetical protein
VVAVVAQFLVVVTFNVLVAVAVLVALLTIHLFQYPLTLGMQLL